MHNSILIQFIRYIVVFERLTDMVRVRASGSVRASDSFVILLHFITYGLGQNGAKLQAQQVSLVAEWLECLQYDLLSSNPTGAHFLLTFCNFDFWTVFTIFNQLHAVYACYFCTNKTEQNKLELAFPFRCV